MSEVALAEMRSSLWVMLQEGVHHDVTCCIIGYHSGLRAGGDVVSILGSCSSGEVIMHRDDEINTVYYGVFERPLLPTM